MKAPVNSGQRVIKWKVKRGRRGTSVVKSIYLLEKSIPLMQTTFLATKNKIFKSKKHISEEPFITVGLLITWHTVKVLGVRNVK